MATFGFAEMRDWAEQSDDPRVRSMWERLSNCRSKIAKWCQAAEYAELRTKNLAAELAALRAEVERLREERRWIPVEERLPTTSEGWVLCSLVGDEVFFGCWHKNEWWSIDDRDGKLSDVTHWQPLPAPPDK